MVCWSNLILAIFFVFLFSPVKCASATELKELDELRQLSGILSVIRLDDSYDPQDSARMHAQAIRRVNEIQTSLRSACSNPQVLDEILETLKKTNRTQDGFFLRLIQVIPKSAYDRNLLDHLADIRKSGEKFEHRLVNFPGDFSDFQRFDLVTYSVGEEAKTILENHEKNSMPSSFGKEKQHVVEDIRTDPPRRPVYLRCILGLGKLVVRLR